jgi:Rac GTPase-activating protein 1
MMENLLTNVNQLCGAGNIYLQFRMFALVAKKKLLEKDAEIAALKQKLSATADLEPQITRFKRQISDVRREYDVEQQRRLKCERDMEKMQAALRKVGAYCARTGADPRDISESSCDDVPRKDVDNFIGRLCHLDTINEGDRNSTSDSVFLSGSDETGSGEVPRHHSRQNRSRGQRSSRGRRSRSVNQRSLSRPRRGRRSSSDAIIRETAFVATTTVHFNPATGEPVRAVATLTNETAKRGLENDCDGNAKRMKTTATNFDNGAGSSGSDTASTQPARFQSTSGGIMASLARTPGMQRTFITVDTPPGAHSSMPHFEPAKHKFFPKNLGLVTRPACQGCGEKLKIKSTVKCSNCCSLCHDGCRDAMPVPCVGLPPRNKYPMTDLNAHVSEKVPKLPVLLVNCAFEVESRGMNTLGLYRVNGSSSKVDELYDRFVAGLKGDGFPALCDEELPVICSLLKSFFKKLGDTLIPAALMDQYVAACADARPGECPAALKDLVMTLPRANRDTLVFLLLHLQRVGKEDAVKMPLSYLARVFGPTIVGGASNPSTVMSCVAVMEALLNAPTDFYVALLNEGVEQDAAGLRPVAGGSIYSQAGKKYQTMNRLRQAQATAKSKIFTSPYLVD